MPASPRDALRSASGLARLDAIETLAPRASLLPPDDQRALQAELARIVASDPAPTVRRAAVRALLALDPPRWQETLAARTDPVWRVRVALVRGLAALGASDPAVREQIRAALRAAPSDARSDGVTEAVEEAWGTPSPPAPPGPRAGAPRQPSPPLHDADPAVLLARLRRADLAPHVASLPALLALDDGKQLHETMQSIRALAVDALLRHGDLASDAAMASALGEPRHPFALSWVCHFLSHLPPRRRDLLAGHIASHPGDFPPGAVGWALRGELPPEQGPSYFPAPHRQASGLAPLPFPAASASVRRSAPRAGGWSRLGLSGRHGLPARSYDEAMEAGVNLLFWEPDYEPMGRYVAALPAARRRALVVVAGSFDVAREAIRRDLEGALRLLRMEQIPVFLLFWVRSSGRLDDDAIEALERQRAAGKIGRWGVSTHDRELGVRAMDLGASVVMTRHSCAHRGAESRLLPQAQERGVAVLTFSCTCYGKLLDPTRHVPAPAALDLYRYSAGQPGVTACLSAPRGAAELRENLGLLAAPDLEDDERQRLRDHGAVIYRRSKRFAELLRSR